MNVAACALEAFVARYLARYPVLHDPFDPDWRSSCECGTPILTTDGRQVVPWRPLARPPAYDFRGLEAALELTIHPDIKGYYGSYWSGGLEATAPEGHVSLILLWNADDVDRLIENLLGHSLAKRRARGSFTVFFACTEPESDLFLAVDNASGIVILERPGHRPIREVAPDLATFLEGLEPAAPGLHPERAGSPYA